MVAEIWRHPLNCYTAIQTAAAAISPISTYSRTFDFLDCADNHFVTCVIVDKGFDNLRKVSSQVEGERRSSKPSSCIASRRRGL